MLDEARGGSDHLFGGAGDDDLRGDADAMVSNARGGNDGLFGGGGGDTLFGDADRMVENAQGGDDRLSGGAGDDTLWGDAREMQGNAQGGNDTFVFDGVFGNDTVGDFRQGEDQLEFDVPGVTDIEDLQIAVVGADTVITADTVGTVTLSGFTGVLTVLDFDFV
jgi:Ca2+-binding RTX toxin-like protein